MATANNIIVKRSQLLFKDNATLVSIDDFTVSSNIRNISSWFEGCIKLSEDFNIPSHITNCTNTFKGCTSMTHVHSNWKNTDNNGITSTDSYADGENVINYDGANGLDSIPIVWGGYGFLRDITGIARVEIPSDNYTLTLFIVDAFWKTQLTNGVDGSIIDWVDGSVLTTSSSGGDGQTKHTYKKAGEYIVKGHVFLCAVGNIKDCVTEIIQVPTVLGSYTARQYMFQECPKLKKADVTGLYLGTGVTEAFQMFNSCPKLVEIIGLDTWDVSKLKRLDYMFCRCSSLVTLDLSNWDITNVGNLTNLASNCSNLSSFYAPKNINVSLSDFTSSTKLSSEQLVAIINNLNTVSTTQTLKLGSTNLAKLNPDEIKIATDKGWTLI